MSHESTPICRCRVLYLGSSVPQQTKDGLQGIQEPLQELYPDQGATGARGIDSWLSVWSNGILLENVDENHKKITRFFPIESLHYCAAIRYVLVPEKNSLHNHPSPRFLPLDSPFARTPNPVHPPLFAAILRRTTGIKVLECHAFICKREVAANALVRCCFHAYADSSYAKQVDSTNGSIYGTLPGSGGFGGSAVQHNGGDHQISHQQQQRAKAEVSNNEWKTRSNSGSTMTINTVGKEVDDVSIYNGDENHKVWAGSQDNLDGGGGGIYDVYASSTISRPSRPRQLQQPVAVPPPPIKEARKKKKNKKNNAPKEEMYPFNGNKANSVSGTMMKQSSRQQMLQLQHPAPIYIMAPQLPHHHHPHPHHQLVPIHQTNPIHQTLPNPKLLRQYGNTFSHRPRAQQQGKMLIPARPVAPPLVPMGPLLVPTPAGTMPNNKNNKKKNKAMEEPIYMPSNRALSPVASYQPVSFPHEAYLMQQYATMDAKNGGKHGPRNTPKAVKNKGMLMANKKLAQSMNGLDQNDAGNANAGGGAQPDGGEEESPYGTGIYRKKGHLNERAFSYSIRQEHRSRSYGSLANLKFATNIPNGHSNNDNGGGEDHREDLKKEREIMQMVHDLDLSGDEIERSEVPRGMYEPRAMSQGPIIVNNSNRHHQQFVNGRNRR